MRAQGLRPRTPSTRSLRRRSALNHRAAAPHRSSQAGRREHPHRRRFSLRPAAPTSLSPTPNSPLRRSTADLARRAETVRRRAVPTASRTDPSCPGRGGLWGRGKRVGGTAGGGGKRRRWGCPPPPARSSAVRRSRSLLRSRAASERSCIGGAGAKPLRSHSLPRYLFAMDQRQQGFRSHPPTASSAFFNGSPCFGFTIETYATIPRTHISKFGWFSRFCAARPSRLAR